MKTIESMNVREMKNLLEYIKHMNSGTPYQDFEYYSRTQIATGYVEFVLKNKGKQVTFDLGEGINEIVRKLTILGLPASNIVDFRNHTLDKTK